MKLLSQPRTTESPPGEREDGALRQWVQTFRRARLEWYRRGLSQASAALAYYAVFSSVPILVLLTQAASWILGRENAQQRVLGELRTLGGQRISTASRNILEAVREPVKNDAVALLIATAVLLFAASKVFHVLQDGLNRVWSKGTPMPRALPGVRRRLMSFGLVMGVGVLFLASVVASAALTTLRGLIEARLPAVYLFDALNFGLSLGLIALLFTVIYRVLPDAGVEWRDAFVGGVAASLLFGFGRLLLGLYFNQTLLGSIYGKAGSVVVLLLWLYFSSHVVFLGAVISRIAARVASEQTDADSGSGDGSAGLWQRIARVLHSLREQVHAPP